MSEPKCVVPGCRQDAVVVFRAIAPGRLAGRNWQPGDTITLCDPHAADVYQVIDIVRLSGEPDSGGWLERA